jgi:diguanylate cyclase (GGDEF)-like protein
MDFPWFTKRFSLAAKFSVCTILLVLVTSVGICLFTIRFENKEHYNELVEQGTAIAAITAKNCEPGITASNAAVLLPILESLSSGSEIAYASVMDRQHSVLASRVFKGPGELSKYSIPYTSGFTEVRYHNYMDERDGKQYLEILYPIIHTGNDKRMTVRNEHDAQGGDVRVSGYLRLGLIQEDFLNTMRQLVISITVFTSFILLAGMGFTILFSRFIVAPLKRLTQATQDIAEGKLDSPIKINTEDELRDLARSFDHMRDRLRAYREQFEERTNELSIANKKLLQEIGARRTAEEQLQHDALHDDLTGLPNRTLFLDRLTHAIMLGTRRKDYLYAVLFLDIDRFKIINDSLGLIVGDKVLKTFSQQIRLSLRPHDTVARFGGDAFAILLEDISSQSNAMYITERINTELKVPFIVDGNEVFITVRTGIAFGNGGDEHPEQILRDAEIAMYKAKKSSKTEYMVFETGMHTHVLERMNLETALRKAVERREMRVYYQPIVSSKTGRMVGFEALVRWLHPDRGIVSPGDFIPIAEETGLIVSIDRFVLREACLQMRDWQKNLPASLLHYVSVNLSNRQMEQTDLVNYVEQALSETGLAPEHLKLEITENVIIKNPESIAVMLDHLRAIGVHLYIDDFGTGYSSLSYLHRLPINGFKIDRSFIQRLGANGENQEIVRTILLLARDLNVEVIAEGIETQNQLAQIRSLNCDYWQGYLFSKPVPATQATGLIEKDMGKTQEMEKTPLPL